MFSSSSLSLIREVVAYVHPMVWATTKGTTFFLVVSTNILIILMSMNLGFVKPSFENQDFILHILALDLFYFIVQ
jgi:hypothetical protein